MQEILYIHAPSETSKSSRSRITKVESAMNPKVKMTAHQPPTFLSLPAEIRLQIYAHILPPQVIYINTVWTGMFNPSGFAYHCLPSILPLLSERHVLDHTIPFTPDITTLTLVCKQMHAETAILPFQTWIWAFESTYTLDRWVTMHRGRMRHENKRSVRTVAVPTPGVLGSTERMLGELGTVLLVGKFKADVDEEESGGEEEKTRILTLKKARESSVWVKTQMFVDV
ncbi:hypothetical protein NX059_002746 [Plenodomus lindquistii]|nr:hypothetical protein NX059_002746 [Plenodomus lindquistii]